ncbi:MAG: CPBP family intramembrane metalloprotease [Chloroflexi bacterium]|nr:CPBP family intramembrane metalloprotease [Chloroflexota bacterium]
MISWVKQHSLLVYFVLAYALSWSIEIPIALSAQGIIKGQFPYAIHYFASFGPLVAAFIVTAIADGGTGIRKLFSGLFKWRVGGFYWLFAVGLPIVFFTVSVFITRLMEGEFPDFALLGQTDYLPYLGIPGALAVWLVSYGLGEEVGWRGFAIPHLQRTRTAYVSSLLLGVIWACWHLPAFFYRDTYIEMGLLVGFPMLLISVTFGSVFLTWLYNSTQGSTLMAIVFHGVFNWLLTSGAGGAGANVIMSTAVIFWAVRAIKVYGTENLSPVIKQIA